MVLRSASAATGATTLDVRRVAALALPAIVPAAMTAVFAAGREQFGVHGGYLVGFGVYWATCAGLSVWLIGRRQVVSLFQRPRRPFARPAIVGAVLLVWPVAGAVATRLIPDLASATAGMLATIVGVALVNSALEEVFWRGVYITLWPSDTARGLIWPAIGFGAWHLAPQVIHPSSLNPLAYVAAAVVMGLSWGWVAQRSATLRWVSLSHLLADASGVRNALFFIGP